MAIALALALQIAPAGLLAHGWYDPDCCSDKDCFGPERGVQGEPIPEGYRIRYGGKEWHFDDLHVRRSKDGFYHICLPEWAERPICVYVPLAGA